MPASFLPSEKFILAEARGEWNAAQVLSAARASSDWLAANDLRPGDVLACGFGNRREAVALGLGAAISGVIVLPLTQAELFNHPVELISRLGCRGVLLDDAANKQLGAGDAFKRLDLAALSETLDTAASNLLETRLRPLTAPDDRPCLLAPTSGSTGRRKYAIHTWADGLQVARRIVEHLNLNYEDTLISVGLRLNAFGFFVQALSSAFAGARLEVLAGAEIGLCEEALRRATGPALLMSHPGAALRFARRCEKPFPDAGKMRYFGVFGGRISEAGRALIQRHTGWLPYRMYGSAETGPVAFQVEGEEEGENCCGRALPGMQVAITGEDGQPLPPDVPGEIRLRSPSFCTGYWKTGLPGQDDKLNVDAGGWFRTKDLGFLDVNGRLFVQGRLDDVIETDGIKFAPSLVESKVEALDGIEQTFFVSFQISEEESGTALLFSGSSTSTQIRQFINANLPPHMRPSLIISMPQVPLLPSGKPDLNLFRQMALKRWNKMTLLGIVKTEDRDLNLSDASGQEPSLS